MTPPARSTHPLSRPFDGFDHRQALTASVWLIFLFAGNASQLAAPVRSAENLLIIAIMVLFSVAYWFFSGSSAYYPRTFTHVQRIITGEIVFVAIALSSIPLLGQWAVIFFPYLAASIAFNTDNRTGAFIIIVMGTALFIIPAAVDPTHIFTYAMITWMWPMFIWSLSVISRSEQTQRRTQEELALTQEREAIARDVHDLLGHSLTVMNLKAELAARLIDTDPEAARREMQHIAALSRTSLAEARSTVTRMRSPNFAGEVEAARRAFTTAGMDATLPTAEHVAQVSGGNAQIFSWALKEATTNILRHSLATTVSVSCSPHMLQVDDNGRGLGERTDPFELSSGLGGLAQRVSDAGGTLMLGRSELGGTRVLVSMTSDTTPVDLTPPRSTPKEVTP